VGTIVVGAMPSWLFGGVGSFLPAGKHELQKKGYQVNHVFTGKNAIQTILTENSEIDLILKESAARA
jgi:hypothetical protein